jgi:hypothetical protein
MDYLNANVVIGRKRRRRIGKEKLMILISSEDGQVTTTSEKKLPIMESEISFGNDQTTAT